MRDFTRFFVFSCVLGLVVVFAFSLAFVHPEAIPITRDDLQIDSLSTDLLPEFSTSLPNVRLVDDVQIVENSLSNFRLSLA